MQLIVGTAVCPCVPVASDSSIYVLDLVFSVANASCAVVVVVVVVTTPIFIIVSLSVARVVCCGSSCPLVLPRTGGSCSICCFQHTPAV